MDPFRAFYVATPALAGFLLLFASCAARHLPAPADNFRLVKAGSQNVLLTPAVPQQQPESRAVAVRFSETAALKRRDAAKCAIKGELFSLARAGREWELRLPPLRIWREEDGGTEVQQAFDEFFAQLEQPAREACLGPGGSVHAARLVQESVSAPASGVPYYRYRYRVGDGFVDLGPGMTLKVERAHFRPGTAEKDQKIANYLGTTTMEFDVVPRKDERLGFRPAGFASNPADLKVKRSELPESKLVGSTTGLPFYRLFVSNDFVPRNFRRSAILLGARTRSRIEEATRALKARPETACGEGPLAGMDCIAFTGRITVSAELWATVQGKAQHIAVGSLVRWVIGPAAQQPPRTLRIDRLYRGRYAPVEFTPGDSAVLELALIGGDRISW